MADPSGLRLSRLLTLVPWLLANDGVTMDEAAEHFQISVEQLEKDLFLLIVSGLPGYGPDQLVDIQFWDDGRIHVLDPQTLDRPLRLSGEEITALLIALRLLAQVPGDHDRQALHSVTARLEAAMGRDPAVEIASSVPSAITAPISEALAERCALRIVYGGAGQDALTDRIVEPHAISSIDGRTYLEAYCRSAQAIRTFRLDRVHSAEVLDDHHRSHDTAIVPEGPEATLVTCVVSTVWAAEALGLSEVEPRPDGRLQGTVTVHDTGWVVHTVLGLGGLAEVAAPVEVRRSVADAARRALASYA